MHACRDYVMLFALCLVSWRAAFSTGESSRAASLIMHGMEASFAIAEPGQTGRRRRRRGSKGAARTHGGKRHKVAVQWAQQRRRVKRVLQFGALDAELELIVLERRAAGRAPDHRQHGGGDDHVELGAVVVAAPLEEAPGTRAELHTTAAATDAVDVVEQPAAPARRRYRPIPRHLRAQRQECAALRRRSARLLLLGSSRAEVSLVDQADLDPLYVPDPDLHKQDAPRRALAAYLAAVCWPRPVAATAPASAGVPSSPPWTQSVELCDDIVLSILDHVAGDASASTLSAAAMTCRQWSGLVTSVQRLRTHQRVAMAGAAAGVCLPSAEALHAAARAGARVVVAMYYDRYRRYVPFSGRLEKRLVDNMPQISVCFDSVACADGIYELSYRAERKLFAFTRGRENEIDPDDPPPLAILNEFYTTRVEAMLTEADLVHYYAKNCGRGARFDAPASLAERVLAPSVAAITAWNEEMGEASAQSGSDDGGGSSYIEYDSSSSSSGGDSGGGDLEDGGEAGDDVRAELHDLLDRSCQEQDGQISCALSKLGAPVHFARPPVGPP